MAPVGKELWLDRDLGLGKSLLHHTPANANVARGPAHGTGHRQGSPHQVVVAVGRILRLATSVEEHWRLDAEQHSGNQGDAESQFGQAQAHSAVDDGGEGDREEGLAEDEG